MLIGEWAYSGDCPKRCTGNVLKLVSAEESPTVFFASPDCTSMLLGTPLEHFGWLPGVLSSLSAAGTSGRRSPRSPGGMEQRPAPLGQLHLMDKVGTVRSEF